MSNPFEDILRAAASQPGMREKLLNMRAPGAQPFTVDEAMQTVEKWAYALHSSSRWPISTTVTREPDGSLTIRVTPHHSR
jgi:hypothetical protein